MTPVELLMFIYGCIVGGVFACLVEGAGGRQ